MNFENLLCIEETTTPDTTLSEKLNRDIVVEELTAEDLENLENLHISYRKEQKEINEKIRCGEITLEQDTFIVESSFPFMPEPQHEIVEGF